MKHPFDTDDTTDIIVGVVVGFVSLFWYYLYLFHEVSFVGWFLVVIMIVVYLIGRIIDMKQQHLSQ